MKKLVGITMGDPAGIGPEISLKALDKEDNCNSCLIFGSQGVIEYYAAQLDLGHSIHYIDSLNEFESQKINVFDVLDMDFSAEDVGKVNPKCGDAAYRYCEKAISLSLNGEIGPVVTAPLNKEALHLGGHNFDGHTEIFATLTKTAKYTMMLWSEELAVVHVSTHVPLRKACDLVKKDRVMECIDLADDALKKLGIQNPRIAVAGLNPHSGENGLFGSEDLEEISPAVEEKNAQGINVTGPVPPDTVFKRAHDGEFDIVVAMYHDQGHIPMKVLAFDEGVNVTLGLPIIRTSVDHGTAFNIAGQGIANESSMLAAMNLAIRFSENS